jgi:hypothetical protein
LLRKLTYICLLLCSISVLAQTRKRNFRQHELGAIGGVSYYIGDLNPRFHFLMSQPAGGLFYRFTWSYRYALRAGFNYGRIAGDDRKSTNEDLKFRNLNFRSNIYEFHVLGEFNFLEYRLGNKQHYFTMFLFGGMAGYHFDPKANLGDGKWRSVAALQTEGVSYARYQFSIPFGIGIKWNVTENIGLGLEWGPRKTYTDYLDDVSGQYIDFSKVKPASSETVQYAYRSGDSYNYVGTSRGNPRTKDWYFFTGFTLNVKLPKSNQPCYAKGL